LRGDLHRVDGFARFDEQARLVDLELGVGHLFRKRSAAAVKSFDERKYIFFNVLQRFVGLQVCPVRPAQFWIRENRASFRAMQANIAFPILFGFVETFEEKQKRKLLNGIERIGQSASPKFIP
jgi:hypothetical protein